MILTGDVLLKDYAAVTATELDISAESAEALGVSRFNHDSRRTHNHNNEGEAGGRRSSPTHRSPSLDHQRIR